MRDVVVFAATLAIAILSALVIIGLGLRQGAIMVWVVRRPYTGLITAILDIEATEAVKAMEALGYVAEKAQDHVYEVGKVLPLFHE